MNTFRTDGQTAAEREEAALSALVRYAELKDLALYGEGLAVSIVDLLTDLMHLIHRWGGDPNAYLSAATAQYQVEIYDEEYQPVPDGGTQNG